MEAVIQGQPNSPIIIKIADPPSELQGLSDILIGSLGLAGLFTLCAVVLAALFAGVLFLWRTRTAGQLPEDEHPHII